MLGSYMLEMKVIGALIMNNSLRGDITNLKEQYFQNETLRVIFKSINEVVEDKKQINYYTITEKAKELGYDLKPTELSESIMGIDISNYYDNVKELKENGEKLALVNLGKY